MDENGEPTLNPGFFTDYTQKEKSVKNMKKQI